MGSLPYQPPAAPYQPPAAPVAPPAAPAALPTGVVAEEEEEEDWDDADAPLAPLTLGAHVPTEAQRQASRGMRAGGGESGYATLD